jgi:hypothetical protein
VELTLFLTLKQVIIILLLLLQKEECGFSNNLVGVFHKKEEFSMETKPML